MLACLGVTGTGGAAGVCSPACGECGLLQFATAAALPTSCPLLAPLCCPMRRCPPRVQAAELEFRRAERALEAERRSVEAAEKAAAAADKKLEK